MKQRGPVVVVLSAMLAACSSLGGLGAMAASKMVTAEDAERILGSPARLVSDSHGEAESLPGGRESRCEYVAAERATLDVVIVTAPSEEPARKAFAESRDGLGSFERVEDVSGLGDEAFVSRSPSSRKLVVRKKAVVFLMDARPSGDPEPAVEELKKTAARLADQL